MFVKKIVLLLLISFIHCLVFSQNDGNINKSVPGKIKGTVLDHNTRQPIEFATIALYKLKDSVLVTGTITNSKGSFTLSELEFGRYFMKINFIGYKLQVIDTIIISSRSFEIEMAAIQLKSNSEQLGQVEVSTEKNAIQLGIDKKIFNVEKSIVSDGGSATDVLQSVPSVSVDIDGNISLRGNGNVTVLIDGKPSSITGSSRTAILQQIPASSIESIELITNPSAKYDPDGMAGIINIVMKRNKLVGFNGSVSAGVGTLDKYNASANISYRNSKVNVYANYGFRLNNRYGSGSGYRKNIFSDTVFYLRQQLNSNSRSTSHNVKTGIDFYLNKKNTLGCSFLYNKSIDSGTEQIDYLQADYNDLQSASYLRNIKEGGDQTSNDYTLNYRKVFDNPKQEFTMDGTYSTAKNDASENYSEQNYTGIFSSKNNTPFQQRISNYTENQVTTIQADYTHPFKNQSKFELGAKSNFRIISTDFISNSYDYSMPVPDFSLDTDLNNKFNFSENIYSSYATYSGTSKKIGYQLGLRAEQANTTSNLITTNEKYVNNYFNIFPTIHLSRTLKKEQELQLSYSRRINRPGIRSLNPFKDYSDPYNIRFGNPYLRPEYINSYELSYLKYLKKGVFTTTAYYRQTDGIMQRYKTVSDSTTISYITFVNLNSSTSYGLELIFKNDITKWWNTTISANVFRTVIDGNNIQAELQNENSSYIFKIISNMRVLKNMDIQFAANYMGPTATAQGEVKPIFSMDLGFKKDIFRNASLSLNITDIADSRKMQITANDSNFYQEMQRKRESRIATLTFSYRFGKAADNKKGKQDKQPAGTGGGEDMGM